MTTMKICFTFIVAAFILFQLVCVRESGALALVRREVPATTPKPSDASQTIDDALQSFKSGLDDLMKNIKDNQFLQNVTDSLKQFSDQVQNQGKQLVEKIQTKTTTTN